MLRFTVLGLLVGVLAPAGVMKVLAAADSPLGQNRPLTPAEMRTVTGGVQADVQWPTSNSWAQSYDNLRFDIAVTNGFGTSSANLLMYADSSKIATQTVSTPASGFTGRWHQRVSWPLNGAYDLQIKYVDPNNGSFVNALGTSSRLDQRLLSTIKVHKLQFWNTRSPSKQTNVSAALLSNLVDGTDPAIPDRNTNLDGIFAHSCPSSTKTQWRYFSTIVASVSDACIDMVASGRSNSSCRDEFYQLYDDAPDRVHVVFVKSNERADWAGAHVRVGNSYAITVREDWATNPDLDALLAHALGHNYIGDDVTSNCSGPRATRNVMCQGLGRVMTSEQCEAARTSTLYPDAN